MPRSSSSRRKPSLWIALLISSFCLPCLSDKTNPNPTLRCMCSLNFFHASLPLWHPPHPSVSLNFPVDAKIVWAIRDGIVVQERQCMLLDSVDVRENVVSGHKSIPHFYDQFIKACVRSGEFDCLPGEDETDMGGSSILLCRRLNSTSGTPPGCLHLCRYLPSE